MGYVTIFDIAKEAKVSIGTVSNVLNNKGNVKVDTIRKVEEVSKRLGYIRNESAKIMKKGDYNVVILLVRILNGAISPLVIDFVHDLKMHNIELKIIETDNLVNKSLVVNQLKQGQYKAVVCLASIKDKELINAIEKNKLIFIGSNDNLTNNVEIDISTLLNFLNSDKEYCVIADRQDFSLYEMLKYKSNNLNMTFFDFKNDDIEMGDLIKKNDQAYIVFSPDVLDKLLSIYENIEIKLPEFILVTCKSGYHFYDNLNIKKFYFSSNELVLKIIKIIKKISKRDNRKKFISQKISVHLTNLKNFNSTKNSKIKLLLLKNPFSTAIEKLADKFTKETNIELLITSLPFNEINILIETGEIYDYDLVKLDVSYFPWLGPELFLNLNSIPHIKELSTTMSNWESYCYVKKELLALPADPSIQMMLYRKDIFNNPVIQKMYSEKYNKKLNPPKTYKDLSEYCSFYQQMDIPEKSIPYPLSVNIGNNVLLSSEFLPYFYSVGGDIKYQNNLFEISSEAFIKTMQIYREIRYNSKLQLEDWWDSEIENFNNSKSSIIICYTNHLNQVSKIDYDYSVIPGKTPAFGGGVLGITKTSSNVDSCVVFFQWLYQYRIQEQLASLGVCIPRTHLFDERNNYREYPFLSYSSNNFSKGKRLQYINKKYIVNTIEIEKIFGNEINKGLENDDSDVDILINIHNQLNINQKNIIRKC